MEKRGDIDIESVLGRREDSETKAAGIRAESRDKVNATLHTYEEVWE